MVRARRVTIAGRRRRDAGICEKQRCPTIAGSLASIAYDMLIA